MTTVEKGPLGQRRGRGARERILEAAEQLFREKGINNSGIDELCSTAQVSKRTVYQHFGSKDELIAELLRHNDPDTMPEIFDRADLTPRDRLLAPFAPTSTGDELIPLCPFIGASVELADAAHPARVRAREYKQSITARLAAAAREAGATDPDALAEQLALLLDGASARTRTLGIDAWVTARAVATALVDTALPTGENSLSR